LPDHRHDLAQRPVPFVPVRLLPFTVPAGRRVLVRMGVMVMVVPDVVRVVVEPVSVVVVMRLVCLVKAKLRG
jgi:hypothetical protein